MSRLRRTVGNWRWWSIVPAWIVLLPVVAIDLMLAAFITAGEEADHWRRKLANAMRPLMRWLRNWTRADHA